MSVTWGNTKNANGEDTKGKSFAPSFWNWGCRQLTLFLFCRPFSFLERRKNGVKSWTTFSLKSWMLFWKLLLISGLQWPQPNAVGCGQPWAKLDKALIYPVHWKHAFQEDSAKCNKCCSKCNKHCNKQCLESNKSCMIQPKKVLDKSNPWRQVYKVPKWRTIEIDVDVIRTIESKLVI